MNYYKHLDLYNFRYPYFKNFQNPPCTKHKEEKKIEQKKQEVYRGLSSEWRKEVYSNYWESEDFKIWAYDNNLPEKVYIIHLIFFGKHDGKPDFEISQRYSSKKWDENLKINPKKELNNWICIKLFEQCEYDKNIFNYRPALSSTDPMVYCEDKNLDKNNKKDYDFMTEVCILNNTIKQIRNKKLNIFNE